MTSNPPSSHTRRTGERAPVNPAGSAAVGNESRCQTLSAAVSWGWGDRCGASSDHQTSWAMNGSP
jgi:hypothetical protein